jgi:hypothetical protein
MENVMGRFRDKKGSRGGDGWNARLAANPDVAEQFERLWNGG